MNLRLEEVEKLFPEGLAGGSQGALERATSRGTSAALLRREAADALIQSLDGFAEAGATGIEGTGSDKWKEISNVYSAAAKKRGAEGEQEGCGEEEGGGGGIGDVAAAAAEGVAAAAAAAEAAEAAASAVAAPAAAGMEAGGQGDTADGEGVEEKKVLGDGPIWAEMKALAESKRKPLKGVARVRVRPGQVRVSLRNFDRVLVDPLAVVTATRHCGRRCKRESRRAPPWSVHGLTTMPCA